MIILPTTLMKNVFSLSSPLILVLKLHAKLSFDLEKLPADSCEKRNGVVGEYFRFHYNIGLSVNADGFEWQFLYKGNVIESVGVQCI